MVEDKRRRNQDFEPQPTGKTHRLTYETSNDADVGLAVIDAICRGLELEPTELGGQLHEYVDVDALNRLFDDRYNGEPRLGGQVSFRTSRYEIVIDSSGVLLVTELEISSRNDRE